MVSSTSGLQILAHIVHLNHSVDGIPPSHRISANAIHRSHHCAPSPSSELPKPFLLSSTTIFTIAATIHHLKKLTRVLCHTGAVPLCWRCLLSCIGPITMNLLCAIASSVPLPLPLLLEPSLLLGCSPMTMDRLASPLEHRH